MIPQLASSELHRLNLRSLPEAGRYEAIIPEVANIAADTVGRHAVGPAADTTAIVFEREDGSVEQLTYRELDRAAGRFAAALVELGVGRGDVVGIHTGAGIETAIAHLATYRLGAIAAAMSQLCGPDTLRHIIRDCRPRVLVTQEVAWKKVRERVGGELPAHCVIGGGADAYRSFVSCLEHELPVPAAAQTAADDPAIIIYTSGSTGEPKGILHGHRVLHGYKTSLALFFDLELDQPGRVFWTPADWAWVGGWFDTVFPAWIHGNTVVASSRRFDPEWALAFMARHGVTHALLLPTALKQLAQIPSPRRPDLKLRTIFTGGEPLAAETLSWLENELGVACNEGYGMTEVNHMIGNSGRLRPIKPGSMGWEIPGHVVRLVDENGKAVAVGEIGEICVSRDDPTVFLGYWKRPDLTAELYLGNWVRTRDLAVQDAEGYYWYHGRNDDLIKSSGFRIGPGEIESALLLHEAVADAVVIGSPDRERGQIVKAFVRLKDNSQPSDELIKALQDHVKERLGSYKYPRKIEFVREFPTTSNGKVSRAELRRRELASTSAGELR